MHSSLELILDKNWDIIMQNLNDRNFKLTLKKFRDLISGWDANYTVDSTQASLFAIWELEFHVSLLADQIPNRKFRETMTNIPDADLFLFEVMDGLKDNPNHMEEYCASNITMFNVNYKILKHKFTHKT